MTHDPHDHPTRATLRALDQQRADTLADALRPDAAPVAHDLDAQVVDTRDAVEALTLAVALARKAGAL